MILDDSIEGAALKKWISLHLCTDARRAHVLCGRAAGTEHVLLFIRAL